jgi:hypothetical protein
VKKLLTIVLAWASLVLMLTFVAAGSFKGEPVTPADALPPYEIVTTVRSIGLRPSDEPVRHGPYYILHATDRRGTVLRVVADAQLGDIVSVAPDEAAAAPDYRRAPHIIQIPQGNARDERAFARGDSRARIDDRDAVDDDSDDDDNEEAAPPPRRRIAPMPQRPQAPRWHSEPPKPRSDATPQPQLAPAPPQAADGPTPLYPTPRFTAKTDPAGKFGQPRDANAPPPPPGNAPPAPAPHDD